MSISSSILNRKIHWVKFKLPTGKFTDPGADEEEEEEESSSPWEREERDRDPMNFMGVGNNILTTPMGVISTETKEEYESSYNMWTAHTTFDLTKANFMALNRMEGIDGLQPMSRYRFNVIIGYLFDENEVKKSIEKLLVGDLQTFITAYEVVATGMNPVLSPELQNQLQAAVSLIEEPIYAILILPNGKMVIVTSKTLTEKFCQEVQKLHVTQSATAGYLHVQYKQTQKKTL